MLDVIYRDDTWTVSTDLDAGQPVYVLATAGCTYLLQHQVADLFYDLINETNYKIGYLCKVVTTELTRDDK